MLTDRVNVQQQQLDQRQNSFDRQIKRLGEDNLKDATSNGRNVKVQICVCIVLTGSLVFKPELSFPER